jgi:hypothetical protein
MPGGMFGGIKGRDEGVSAARRATYREPMKSRLPISTPLCLRMS